MQLCTLLSIKTGGCSEDCGYCAQSARYTTGVKAERLMGTPEVLAAAHQAQGQRLDALLHGRGVARGARRDREIRAGARHRARGVATGHGGVRHLGTALRHGGRAAQGSGRHRVQPQHRHVAGLLPGNRDDPHLPGPARHHPGRAGQRHGAVLRRNRRPGRNRRRPAQDAGRAHQPGPRAGERAHQLPDGHARHAAWKPSRRWTSSISCA